MKKTFVLFALLGVLISVMGCRMTRDNDRDYEGVGKALKDTAN